jgi:folate-binding protein YgfZ
LLDRFTLAGDFRLTDLTIETAMFSVQGNDAAKVVLQTLGETAMNRQGVTTALMENGAKVTIIRATHTAEDGFDLFVDRNEAPALHDSLSKAGAQPVSADTLEVLRIEAGIPSYGVDMDETNVVTETNLDDAVSFTKGCYIGQEIIARIKYRGHVAKKLSGLIFEKEVVLEDAARILSSDDKEIGRLTSTTFSPRLNRTVALGYVKYDYLTPGTNVKVAAAEKEVPAIVAELPFVRGSWYSD